MLEWPNPTHKHFTLTFPMLLAVLGQADPTMPMPCWPMQDLWALGEAWPQTL